jgi:hypothetical protein
MEREGGGREGAGAGAAERGLDEGNQWDIFSWSTVKKEHLLSPIPDTTPVEQPDSPSSNESSPVFMRQSELRTEFKYEKTDDEGYWQQQALLRSVSSVSLAMNQLESAETTKETAATAPPVPAPVPVPALTGTPAPASSEKSFEDSVKSFFADLFGADANSSKSSVKKDSSIKVTGSRREGEGNSSAFSDGEVMLPSSERKTSSSRSAPVSGSSHRSSNTNTPNNTNPSVAMPSSGGNNSSSSSSSSNTSSTERTSRAAKTSSEKSRSVLEGDNFEDPPASDVGMGVGGGQDREYGCLDAFSRLFRKFPK